MEINNKIYIDQTYSLSLSLSYISLSSGVLSLCFFIIIDVKRALQFRSPIKASAAGVAFRRRRRTFCPHKLSYFSIVLLEFRESSACCAKVLRKYEIVLSCLIVNPCLHS